MSMQNKVVLVTGGSKGIGKAVVLAAAAEGASVVVNYQSDKSAADQVVQEIGSDRAFAFQADASNIQDLQKLVDATVERFGRIDVVMPNAGLMPMRTAESTSEADFDATYNTNVKGPYFLVQKALPHMQSGSRVIFVSTSLCHVSTIPPPYLLYASTKGAVEQMTRFMARDFAKKGINVNAVAPGPVATDFFFKGKSEELVNMNKAASPFGRLGTPEEIADVVMFLCRKESNWITGQVIKANGGMV